MPKSQPHHRNPIHLAVQRWLTLTHPIRTNEDDHTPSQEQLLGAAPKRYTIYEPMVLLPTGSFTAVPWTQTLGCCSEEARDSLWSLILEELSRTVKDTLTHLAINEGIPLHQNEQEIENILRSPSGLRMLYGDFGPAEVDRDRPSKEDMDKALWASTKQNGIYQTWAPRWTMFSRGNIKEKARLLEFGSQNQTQTSDAAISKEFWAVDLYAGIGYFVFCYATLGMRTLCWEINPWSVEGLRRGAEANRWTVKVICGEDLKRPIDQLMAGGEQIIVFLEDNNQALDRLRKIWSLGLAQDIRHVNCGFLPSSEPTWEQAWHMTSHSAGACLHLHENVGVNDINSRRETIQHKFESWRNVDGSERQPTVNHVELVKTFAPGVWHCVFDVDITRSIGT